MQSHAFGRQGKFGRQGERGALPGGPATGRVIVEGAITRRQLVSELLEVPDLARGTGREPGLSERRAPARA